jgi:hypothetical protein
MKTQQPKPSDLVKQVRPAVRALEAAFGKEAMKQWTASQKAQVFAAMSTLIRIPTGRRADPEISQAIALRSEGKTMRQIARQILPNFRYETPREQTYMVERLRKRVSNRQRYERKTGRKVSDQNNAPKL